MLNKSDCLWRGNIGRSNTARQRNVTTSDYIRSDNSTAFRAGLTVGKSKVEEIRIRIVEKVMTQLTNKWKVLIAFESQKY